MDGLSRDVVRASSAGQKPPYFELIEAAQIEHRDRYRELWPAVRGSAWSG